MAKRITMIFFAWSLIYLLPLNIGAFMITGVGPIKVSYWNVVGLLNEPVSLLMQGTKDIYGSWLDVIFFTH